MAFQNRVTDRVGGVHPEAYIRVMQPLLDVASAEVRLTFYWYHDKAWAMALKPPFEVTTYSIPLAKLLVLDPIIVDAVKAAMYKLARQEVATLSGCLDV